MYLVLGVVMEDEIMHDASDDQQPRSELEITDGGARKKKVSKPEVLQKGYVPNSGSKEYFSGMN